MTNGKKLRMLDMISRTVEGSKYYVEVTRHPRRYAYRIMDNSEGTIKSDGTIDGGGLLTIDEPEYFFENSQDFFKLMEAYMMIPLMIKDKWDVEIDGW